MKKLLLSLIVIGLLSSCGSTKDVTDSTPKIEYEVKLLTTLTNTNYFVNYGRSLSYNQHYVKIRFIDVVNNIGINCDDTFKGETDLHIEYTLSNSETPYVSYPKGEEMSCTNIIVFIHNKDEYLEQIIE